MTYEFRLRKEPFDFSDEFDDYENGLLESDREFADLEEEEEARRGSRAPGSTIRGRTPPVQLRLPPRRRRPPRTIFRPWRVSAGVIHEPSTCTCPEQTCPQHGSEYIRWVQITLNRILGLRLPLNGVLTPATRSAVRSFQEREKLPVTGFVGPDTEQALIAAKGGQSPGAGATKPDEPGMTGPPEPAATPPEPGITEPAEPTPASPAAEFEFEWEVGPTTAKRLDKKPFSKWLKLFPDAKRSKADFVIDGENYYESVIRAIETAKTKYDYIYILGWMLDIDLQLVKSDKKKTLFNLLKDRAERGVEIRILVWDNLIPGYAKLYGDAIPRLNRLPNTKVYIDEHTFFPQASKQLIRKIAPYISDAIKKYGHLLMNPAARLEENHDVPGSYILYRLLTLINQQTIGAHHEKVVIVKGDEGLIAYCGGIDFNKNRVISTVDWPKAGVLKSQTVKRDFWFPYYHDNACRLRGPAAYDVLQKFKKRWINHPVAKKESLIGTDEPKPKEAVAPYPYVKVVGTYNSPDGRDKDRSLKEAYLKIIQNAESYIYIEDQYLVNLEVAKVLNRKIKEPKFRKLTFAIQDSIETADIFIPNRKRGEFLNAVFQGANDLQMEKVLVAVIDRSKWDKEFYHLGMHAKTLIVDDEIAIIGSANVNQRSFTCDSETSVIVFDDNKKVDQNFARIFRIVTWKDFLRKPTDRIMYDSWWNYPTEISKGNNSFSRLIKYTKDEQLDLDERLKNAIRKAGVVGVVAAYQLSGKNLTTASAALSPHTIKYIFDTLWEHIVDPVCP